MAFLEPSRLALVFNTLGGNAHPQAVGKRNDGANDRLALLVRLDIPDEVSVDLDRIKWEVLQIRERRVTGAELVE
ncbi:hypothetical protein D3C78_1870590 [compost metagenome]